eukprot:g59093.t1
MFFLFVCSVFRSWERAKRLIMASEAKMGLKIGCCVSFIAAMEIDSESLFTRFGKNAETIRVIGKLKNLKEKVGVVSIRNLEESWDVRIPKGFLRWEVPEKLFKFIDHTGKVVWDSVTDERPVVKDGDHEAFTKTPLARSVTKDSFLKSINDSRLADVHFGKTDEVKKGLNKRLLARGMAQQIVDGDIKWEDVVRNEIDLVPEDESELHSDESGGDEEEESTRPPRSAEN